MMTALVDTVPCDYCGLETSDPWQCPHLREHCEDCWAETRCHDCATEDRRP